MKKINITAKHDKAEVLKLIEFVQSVTEAKCDEVHLNIKGTSGTVGGMAYFGVPKISNADNDAKYLVTLRVGSEYAFPHTSSVKKWVKKRGKWILHDTGRGYGGKSSPVYNMKTWQEGVIAVLAHELKHIWQYQNNAKRSEVEAEKEAARVLELYRGAVCI